MKFSKSFIDQVLSRVDLVDVVQSRVALKQAGRTFKACCPFHQEKTPSFNVNQDRQFFHCFGCGESGDAVSFLMKYDSLSFVDAIEELAKLAGLDLPKQRVVHKQGEVDLQQLLTEAAKLYQQSLHQHPSARQYLLNRGLDNNTLDQFQIGYAPDQWDFLIKKLAQSNVQHSANEALTALEKVDLIVRKDQQRDYDRFRDRVMFPIHNRRGRVVGFGGRVIHAEAQPKYLNSAETVLFRKRHELYGLYQCLRASNRADFLLVTEGYMDVVALHQAGLPKAVAAMGTALSSEQLTTLYRFTHQVVLCFDGDQAGKRAAHKSLHTLLPILKETWQLRFLILPESEDPDTYVRQHGLDAFQVLIQKALSVLDFIQSDLQSVGTIGQPEFLPMQVSKAKEWIQRSPDNAWRESLIKGLKELLGVNEHYLLQPSTAVHTATPVRQVDIVADIMADIGYTQTAYRPQRRYKSTINKQVMTLEQRLLKIILNFPKLVKDLDGKQCELLAEQSTIIQQMLPLLLSDTPLNPAVLVRHWQDTPTYTTIEQLLTQEHLLDETGSAEELEQILESIQRQKATQLWQEIQDKVKAFGLSALSDEEKQVYKSPSILNAENN